jgi:arylsulfatase A-like enzyme
MIRITALTLSFICSLNFFQTVALPNIILIFMDDGGYADIGGSEITTPHIDSIKHNGVDFVNSYVTAPQCSPSRVGLLTGRYQQHYGHETNAEMLLALSHNDTKVIPQYLPQQYKSAIFGKWNLGDVPNDPLKHGFHERYLYYECEQMFQRSDYLLNGVNVSGREYCNSIMFDKSSHFIKQTKQPFFLYLAPMCPHQPLVYPPQYDSIYNNLTGSARRRKFLTLTKLFDDGVGTVLNAVKARNIMKDTIIIYLNDNGAPRLSNISGSIANYPLRGSKGDVYEGGIHVRNYMQWTGTIIPGTRVSSPVISLDIIPTIIDIICHENNLVNYLSKRTSTSTRNINLMQVTCPFHTPSTLDGVSYLSLLDINRYTKSVSKIDINRKYTQTKHYIQKRVLFWRFYQICSVPQIAARRGDMKWIYDDVNKISFLYNITSDISEKENIAELYNSIALKFESEYKKWVNQFPALPNRECVTSKRNKE